MWRTRSLHQCAALMSFAVTLAGCAHALKELPPLREVVGGSEGHAASEVDDLLARAQDLYAKRTAEGVKQAADLWLAAAAADPSRVEGLLGAARAHVWVTEHAPDAEARLDAATRAVQEAGWCARIAPAEPACDYWLGAALGVQARERPTTGLSALPRIVESFERAAASSPGLEEGGPDRALALVYLKAPGWPAGPGDLDLAVEHARKAVALAPGHPPNHLTLAEVLARTGDVEGRREACRRALDLAEQRSRSGDPDAPEWILQAQRALAGP